MSFFIKEKTIEKLKELFPRELSKETLEYLGLRASRSENLFNRNYMKLILWLFDDYRNLKTNIIQQSKDAGVDFRTG